MNDIAIFQLLSSNTNLVNVVGTDIWPEQKTEDNDNPYVVYTVMTGEQEFSESLEAGLQPVIIQIDGYSKSHEETRVMAAAIDQQFQARSLAHSGVRFDRLFRQSRRHSFEPETSLHRFTLEYGANISTT